MTGRARRCYAVGSEAGQRPILTTFPASGETLPVVTYAWWPRNASP